MPQVIEKLDRTGTLVESRTTYPDPLPGHLNYYEAYYLFWILLWAFVAWAVATCWVASIIGSNMHYFKDMWGRLMDGLFPPGRRE